MDEYYIQTKAYDSEEEDRKLEEESVLYLKDNFDFNDFWDYPPTQKILKNEFLQQFNETTAKQILEFYLGERSYYKQKSSNLFAFDSDGTKAGFLESIVFNHIKKDYDIEIFYKYPHWANSFVKYQLENDKKEKKKVFIVPMKSLRTFNWATKTFTKK